MTLETVRPNEIHSLVDPTKGTVDRRIFVDQTLYELELERIFARAWNFMCHTSQIPNPGDFFMTFIGEDRVIVVRDNEGKPQVLINSCRHRGNAVCRAEEGHATSFMCTYHGWTYDLRGNLVGVPGFKEVYHEELDRENWGLITAAHVDEYKGFIFATMDQEAPGLREFLGDVGAMSIDFIAERGNIKVVPGVQKYVIPCNWKLAVDNVWDYYHAKITHGSAVIAGWGLGMLRPAAMPSDMRPQIALLGEFGHAFSGPSFRPDGTGGEPTFETGWRDREETRKALGPITSRITSGHPNIFPNMWITQACQVSMRIPKGPTSTEIWWFTILDEDITKEQWTAQKHRDTHHFGPAGIFEQEDGENWEQSTRGAQGVIARQFPLHYGMGLGKGDVIIDEDGPPRVEGGTNEHAQLWHYRAWAEWMAAESWADLKANHSQVPTDRW